MYCRQPDSSAPNLNFGVDHYRPKSIPRFAGLLCAYNNLYYCCGACNSRKNNDWPLDEKAGPFVVNPCDFSMAEHLRFNSVNGIVETKTAYGVHTEYLLQLNDDASVQYRLGVLRTVKLYNAEIASLNVDIDEIKAWYKSGKIGVDEYNRELAGIENELKGLIYTLQSHTGQLPLPTSIKKKFNVPLVANP